MFDVHFLQTGSNFDSELSSAEVLLVNFYAPWYVSIPSVNCRRLFLCLILSRRCPWSARLAPIWEATAALIHAK